jgi:GNAT superfamily N-acetyltransferase
VLTVEPVTATFDALDSWCEQYCVGCAADSCAADSDTLLSAAAVAARILAEAPAADGVLRWGARRPSELVGIAQTRPDRGAAFVRLYVPAQHRRRGIGRAILGTVSRQLNANALRGVVNAGEAGEQFAASMGAREIMRLVVMSQRLADLQLPRAPLPHGHELVVWRGRAPDRLLSSYVAAKRHIADAPSAHEQLDAAWDNARLRAWEQAVRANGQTLWVCAAVHDGAVVAFTELEVGAHPVASQHDTVVLPGHRGVGLAMAVKAHLVRELRRIGADVASVTSTLNAANHGMIAANRRLGYRTIRERVLVESRGASRPERRC